MGVDRRGGSVPVHVYKRCTGRTKRRERPTTRVHRELVLSTRGVKKEATQDKEGRKRGETPSLSLSLSSLTDRV